MKKCSRSSGWPMRSTRKVLEEEAQQKASSRSSARLPEPKRNGSASRRRKQRKLSASTRRRKRASSGKLTRPRAPLPPQLSALQLRRFLANCQARANLHFLKGESGGSSRLGFGRGICGLLLLVSAPRFPRDNSDGEVPGFSLQTHRIVPRPLVLSFLRFPWLSSGCAAPSRAWRAIS